MEVTYELTQAVLSDTNSTTIDLLLTFRAETPNGRQGGRWPLSLSMVIDKSGSMSGQPIKHATQAAELLVRQLGPQDYLSVVAYDHSIKTVVPHQQVTNAAAISKEIRKIRAGGSTNLHGGWLEGCQHVAGITGEKVVRRVLLLTDGQANVGISDNAQLIALAREQAQQGVITTTLGFGRDFNEDLLIGMAEAAGGNFYYIETPADASQVFLIEGESLTSLAAQNLTVTLIPRDGSGVKIHEVINHLPAQPGDNGSLSIMAGDVYGGEDKLLAIQLEIPPQSATTVPLLDVVYTYNSVTDTSVATSEQAVKLSGQLAVMLPVSAGAVTTVDFDLLRTVGRIRIARAKEEAVVKADANNYAHAAGVLRREVTNLRARQLDEEFEIAEEIAQLEYFADQIEHKRYNLENRKMLRDQSYQGRTRNRSDLNARGSAGGSARSLPTTETATDRVEVVCLREGGKLRVKVLSEGFEPDLNVLLPRTIREEGVHYLVEGLETSKNGTFYRPQGQIYRYTGVPTAAAMNAAANSGDPLALTELFQGGEDWLPLLKPVIEAQSEADQFIGPQRDQKIVPVRELTFQALKPNPPEKWKVVIFGQNPYPRVESATGIAMFDNTFGNWKDSQFGKVTSIRCIIKAATMWKHNIPKATPIADIRALLAEQATVQPPEWFQAILTQGVLLLNAALTASSDGTRADTQEITRHTNFWKPVVEKILAEILKAKQGADDEYKGVVFAWWGTSAKALRKLVEKLQKQYPKVPVKHIDHPNPAAQGDIFCDNNHFGAINEALRALGMSEIDWLPSLGWNKTGESTEATGQLGEADRMGDFIAKTMELHKFYLERLQEVKEEGQVGLPAIQGIMASLAIPLTDAVTPLLGLVKGLDYFVKRAAEYAQRKVSTLGNALGELNEHEIAAVYLYTCESIFYRQVNAGLRDPDREKVKVYYPYLRLLLSALGKMKGFTGNLWRGVAMDLRGQYPKGSTIIWWGVSSCTAKLSVAHAFLGFSGKRTLFEIKPLNAVGIRVFSAFTGEDEYLLPPGAQLKVTDVQADKSGLVTIYLEEIAGERPVS